MLITMEEPRSRFTKAPNELLYCRLSPALILTWLQLASLCRDGESRLLTRRLAGAAEALGVEYSKLAKNVQRLKRSGAIRQNGLSLELVVPSKEGIDKAEKLSIADEIQEEQKRKPSGLSQKESMAQIKEAWNENKPEGYFKIDGTFPLPLFIAIETQAKRLNIERPDYPDFVSEVLMAAGADSWWSAKNFKASNLFGWSAELDDKKFKNIEKLYKSPNKLKKQHNYLDEIFWIKWYDGYKDISKVEFKLAEDYWEALDRVEEEQDDATAYVWHKEGTVVPHHWTGRNDQTTRKFRYLP
jgi:hypothetical protein